MPSLADVMHMPHVAALLGEWLAPKDTINFIVWALEDDLVDGPVQLLAKFDAEDAGGLRSRLVNCAAASGFRVAFTRLQRQSLQETIWAALLREDRLLPAGVVHEAAKRGDLATVQWLSSFVAFPSHEAMAFAAANGHLEVAWRISHLAKPTDPVIAGELVVHCVWDTELMAMTWTTLDTDGDNEYVKYFATKSFGLAPVQRGRERGYIGAMDIVAQEGDLALLQTLHDDPNYSWSCTTSAFEAAASRGSLDVLQWLTTNRTKGCTQVAMDSAARNGHVDCMTFLRDHHNLTLLTSSTLLAALEGGHLPVLAWMQDQPQVFSSLLRLVSRPSLVEAACVSPDRLRILQWLDDVLDIRFTTKPAMSLVLNKGDVTAAQWLADPLGDGANLVQWDGVVAKWMSFEFALWHYSTFSGAAVNGHLHVVEWLSQAGSFHKVEPHTLWQCATRGHLQVVEFILQRPLHQPKDLVFLPHTWTSFYGAAADHWQSSSSCVWDPLAWNPPWAKGYVDLWMRYRPGDCKHVPWLAKWAAYCGHRELYEQLCG
jgi:hypothetical protein